MADMIRQSLRATARAEAQRGLIVVAEVGTTEPADYPLTITRGATWLQRIAYYSQASAPVDLSTGFTAAFVIYGDSLASPYLTLASGAAISLADGDIAITQTAAEIAAYTWGPRARYRLTVTDTGASPNRTYALLTGWITAA